MFNIDLINIILENESYPVLFREQFKRFMESVYPDIAFGEDQENFEVSISNSDEKYSCNITHTCDNTTSRITVSYLNNIEEVVNVEAEHEEIFDNGNSRIISYFGKLYPNNQEYFEIESIRNLYNNEIEEYSVMVNEPVDDSNKVSAFSYDELTRKLASFSEPEMVQKKVKNNK